MTSCFSPLDVNSSENLLQTFRALAFQVGEFITSFPAWRFYNKLFELIQVSDLNNLYSSLSPTITSDLNFVQLETLFFRLNFGLGVAESENCEKAKSSSTRVEVP